MDGRKTTLYLEFADPEYRYELISSRKVYEDLRASIHRANRNLNCRYGIYILEDTVAKANAGITMTVVGEDFDVSKIKSGRHFRGISVQMFKIDPGYRDYRVGTRLFNYVLA